MIRSTRYTALAFAIVLAAALQAGLVAAEGMRLDDKAPLFGAGPAKALDLTDEVTLEAWVKADPMGQGGGRILDKTVPGTQDGYTLANRRNREDASL